MKLNISKVSSTGSRYTTFSITYENLPNGSLLLNAMNIIKSDVVKEMVRGIKRKNYKVIYIIILSAQYCGQSENRWSHEL